MDSPKNILLKLQKREENNSLRSFKNFSEQGIDFSSNDYLGFSQNKDLEKDIIQRFKSIKKIGSTGSRLISGNSAIIEQTEQNLARFYKSETALVFHSGYDANSGLLSCIAGKDDTIIYDEYIHASLREGIQLSPAKSIKFKHQDLQDLSKKIETTSGTIFLVIESLYSMDGDITPLANMIKLTSRKDLFIILDEAHSTGLYGPKGEGLAVALGLEDKIFARIHTFGKALGLQGAVILGSHTLKKYLVNFCKPFIYSTAPSPLLIAGIDCVHEYIPFAHTERKNLFENIHYYNARTKHPDFSLNQTPIQYLTVQGNQEAKKMAHQLLEVNINVVPILSPTVPEGKERIRVNLHSFNTHGEIDLLLS